jgi:hypothetical protein
VKGTAFVAAALLAACAGTRVHAQIPSVAQTPPDPTPQSAPVVSPPRVAQDAQASSVDQRDVRMMETVLTSAVRNGAENISRQMQAQQPGSLFVVDMAKARGFVLEGYGIFFAVDVPMMRQAAVWSARQLMQRDLQDQIGKLNALASDTTRDLETRRQAAFQARLLGLQLQGANGSTVTRVPDPVGTLAGATATPVANGSTPPPGAVRATVVDEKSAVAAIDVAPVSALTDPNDLYTEAVKAALIDAMLKHSLSLHIGDNEWLTVAARDGEGPPVPGQIDDASTIVISIKGSDLSAFITNKLTRDEVLKRVKIREF